MKSTQYNSGGALQIVKTHTRWMGSLITAVERWIRSRDPSLFTTERSSTSSNPLLTLLLAIHHLPFSWRKLILDACRVQESILHNDRLREALHRLPSEIVSFSYNRTNYEVTPLSIADYFENLYDSTLCCSILSYFVRAESTAYPSEAVKIREETITKEISAALYYKPIYRRLDYFSLIGSQSDAYAWGSYPSGNNARTKTLFSHGIRQLVSRWSREDAEILFPYYNGSKNVGYTTQDLYERYIDPGGEVPETGRNVSTQDLLVLYHRTGKRIGGPLEVRCKWGYGDLKPRLYYSLGGDGYWEGLYIQPIANAICRILPSTHPFTRFDISRIGELQAGELLITYDYTSFTTSLEELKYFLSFLAREFEGVSLLALDVWEGLVDLDIGEYLHRYNEAVNHHQEFDLRRLKEFKATLSETVFHQGRSGSLGTQGNIVFSTALHGLNISSFTGTPEKDSCVGDDALVKIMAPLFQMMIATVNHLGEVNPDKFAILQRPPPDDPTMANRQQYKYLKRPITVDFEGNILTGTLDAFPGLAELLFPEGDGFHQVRESDNPLSGIRAFCTQWGRYLYRHTNTVGLSYTSNDELEIIIATIQMVYSKFRIDEVGQIPGSRIRVKMYDGHWDWVEIDFFAPPCDSPTVFESDWVQLLLARLGDQYFPDPLRIQGEIPLEIHAKCGHRQMSTNSDGLLRLLEALGYVSTEVIIIQQRFDEKYADRLRDLIFHRVNSGSLAVDVCFLADPPIWYYDVAIQYMPAVQTRDPLGKLDEISSIVSLQHEMLIHLTMLVCPRLKPPCR
jgi:hypothetical protein